MDQGKLSLKPDPEILVIRFKSLGDILLSTVIPRYLVEVRPDARVDMIVDETFAGVTAGLGFIRRELVRPRGWAARAAQVARLFRRYDIVLDLQATPASAALGRSAARDMLVGNASKRVSRLYSVAVEDAIPARHTTEANLDFLESLGLSRPACPVPAVAIDEDAVRAWKMRFGPRSVIIHPGARFPHKMWPAERFREVADRLLSAGRTVAVLAGPGERVPAPLACLPLVTGIRPGELGSLMAGFDLFVGNDSGPMHFAAAAGCRVVGLFGPTDIHRWRPLTSRAEVVVAPCRCGAGHSSPCVHGDGWCLGSISVESVMEAIGRAGDR